MNNINSHSQCDNEEDSKSTSDVPSKKSGKKDAERRPKTYNLTTNDQRRKLLELISVKGHSVLKV